MNTAELPRRIDELVNLLRTRDERSISLVDVASVTGILISTMQAYFGSIDTRIYSEFTELSDYMEKARKDIAAIAPDNINEEHIPRAGEELEAIVEATEEATNTIMTAAEEIMGADHEDSAAFQTLVDSAVMQIFEACSFQDITGQRISKVVETFTYIENRLAGLSQLISKMDGPVEIAEQEETEAEKRKRELMLNGPQLKKDAKGQAEIDALLDGTGDDQGHGQASAPKQPARTVADTAPEDDPLAKKAASASDEAGDMSADGEVSQEDIDMLFN